MNYRKATNADIKDIMHVIDDAKQYLRDQGIDQWQNGMPNEVTIKNDLLTHESYVFLINEQIVGYLTINLGEEISYHTIYDGAWALPGSNHGTIHRTALLNSCRGQGLATCLFEVGEEVCRKHYKQSVRIDTHEDNRLMQHLIQKNGYQFCGIIRLEQDNTERFVYEKILI